MRIIGITGSIACGKSTVSSELIRLGYPVVDGDLLSRELTAAGGAAIPDIRTVFGPRYLRQDGSLNRRAMGQLVFSDPSARKALDDLMAPHLQSLTVRKLQEIEASGAFVCFLDMPLLFEKGYDSFCNEVWCVWIPESLKLTRLIQRDGYTREEALSRIHAVMSSDEKARRSDAVINNSGTVPETYEQLSALLSGSARAQTTQRRRRADRNKPPEVIPAADVSRPEDDISLLSSVDRPDSARRKPSGRKVSWKLPAPLSAILIILVVLLAVSGCLQLWMNAYLSDCRKTHRAEQQSIDDHYPLMYRELIERMAGEYNLAPSFVASVIKNESSFDPGALSGKGARGLMQLMPDTAEWIAHKLRFDYSSPEQLTDPEINVRFGCWYLNYLSSLFDADPLCVVCAYHAGQGEISTWLMDPSISSDGKTMSLQSLPEGPTKVYAGRVTRDYGIYQEKYFTDSVSVSGGADDSVPAE